MASHDGLDEEEVIDHMRESERERQREGDMIRVCEATIYIHP
jgi:hypothetical protein